MQFLQYAGLAALVALIMFPVVNALSNVAQQGIAFARADDHRITPESPWYFFMQYISSKRKDLINVFLLTVVAPVVFCSVVGIKWNWSSLEWITITLLFLLVVGYFTCGSFVAILLLAPRIQSSSTMIMIAIASGVVATYGMLLILFNLVQATTPPAAHAWLYLRVRAPDGGYTEFPLLIPAGVLISLCIPPAAWSFVRYVVGEKWFRLDKS